MFVRADHIGSPVPVVRRLLSYVRHTRVADCSENENEKLVKGDGTTLLKILCRIDGTLTCLTAAVHS